VVFTRVVCVSVHMLCYPLHRQYFVALHYTTHTHTHTHTPVLLSELVLVFIESALYNILIDHKRSLPVLRGRFYVGSVVAGAAHMRKGEKNKEKTSMSECMYIHTYSYCTTHTLYCTTQYAHLLVEEEEEEEEGEDDDADDDKFDLTEDAPVADTADPNSCFTKASSLSVSLFSAFCASWASLSA
jgi:hypothetical protein